MTIPAAAAEKERAAAGKKANREALRSEPIPDLHPEAGGHLTDDGGRGSGRVRSVPATSGVGAAAGRLPDHADPDVLSGRQPGGGDVLDHRAARKTVRAGAGTDA